MTLANEPAQAQADADATCPVCEHAGYLHDVDGCYAKFDGQGDDLDVCRCRIPRRLVRAVTPVPAPPDGERWNLTADAWYALEDAETARQDALDDDDGYDWHTPRYDQEGTRPWDLNA